MDKERYEVTVRRDDGVEQLVSYSITDTTSLILRLTSAKHVRAFDDPFRRTVGFIVDGEAFGLTLSSLKLLNAEVPRWFATNISTPAGRSYIASRCSNERLCGGGPPLPVEPSD